MAEEREPEETVGSENTIPKSDEGVSVGHTESSHFEPEEDAEGAEPAEGAESAQGATD
jgi:hypothetical protein